MRLKSALEAFQTYLVIERRITKNTHVEYIRDVSLFINFMEKLNITNTKSLTPTAIKQYRIHLRDIKNSARTIARKLSSLRAWFKFLQQRFEIDNHFENIEYPKFERRLPDYLSEQDIIRILNHLESKNEILDLRNKIIFQLLYVTGMRITELCSLKITDLKLDDNVITVFGKGSKQRILPIPKKLSRLISKYINQTRKKILKKRKTDYLFAVYYGETVKPLTRQAVWTFLQKLGQETNLKINPHKLRHNFATHLLKSGFNLRMIQTLLGHEHISTTEIYTHVDIKHLKESYDKHHPRAK